MQSGPFVTRFGDYRAFLLAHAQEKKRSNPRWTFGAWAKRLGLKTTSSLTKVINGQRNPGPEITDKLIDYFSFSNGEANYFRDLVQLHKVKRDPRLSVVLMERLQSQTGPSDFVFIDSKTFAVISDWYCYAIREMVQLDEFFEDSDWISRRLRFKVAPREVRKAIRNLLAVGLLKRNSKGLLELAETRIDTTPDVANEAIKRYHEQSLENAKLAVRSVDVSRRDITSTTFVTDSHLIPEAKAEIRKFRTKFAKLFERAKGDSVYQFQLSYFPLTRFQVQEEEKSNA